MLDEKIIKTIENKINSIEKRAELYSRVTDGVKKFQARKQLDVFKSDIAKQIADLVGLNADRVLSIIHNGFFNTEKIVKDIEDDYDFINSGEEDDDMMDKGERVDIDPDEIESVDDQEPDYTEDELANRNYGESHNRLVNSATKYIY